MAVIQRDKRWPNSRVPFILLGDKSQQKDFRKWLLVINDALGYSLMVDREDADVDYLEISHGGGNSENIGNNGGRQVVTARTEFVLHHEVLHALGFHHEQLHSGYGWSLAPLGNIARKNVGTLKGYKYVTDSTKAGKLRAYGNVYVGDENVDLYEKIQETGYQSVGIDMNFAQWIYIQGNHMVESYRQCDTDSVMMYLEMGKGAKKIRRMGSGVAPKSTDLSNGDVQAIRYMYPAPVQTIVSWDHHMIVNGYSSLPYVRDRDRLWGRNDMTFRTDLRKIIDRNQYAAEHGGLRILVAGRGDDPWRKVINTVLTEAQLLYTTRGFLLEVIPVKDTQSLQTEVLICDK